MFRGFHCFYSVMEEVNKSLQDIERDELNLLIKRGVHFTISYKVRERVKGFRGFFRKKEEKEVTETFEIQECTLSVLDRLTEFWLKIRIDEERLQGGGLETLVEAKNIAAENARNAARVVAIAVLGEDYHITEVGAGGRIRRYNDDKELDRLTELFYHTVKPSKLVGLANTVTNMANLGDFIGSMRLWSGAKTTQPKTQGIE